MSKARDLANAGTALGAVSATELGYVDGVTSAIQTQIDTKEATLPSQTGNSGKYLTTNGTAKSWGTVSQYALPTQTGNSGKYLTTNGTAESWGTISAGGMTLLSTTTLSGASTLITGIDQSYTNLIVVIHSMTNATADGSFRLEWNTLTSGQGQRAIGWASPNTYPGDMTQNQKQNNSISVPNNFDRTSNANVVYINTQNYSNTTFEKPQQVSITYTATTGQAAVSFQGSNRNLAGITDMNIFNTGGNWSTGTVLIYGVK
jgi:hypothetical protein